MTSQSEKKIISYVIVTMNRKELLRKCVNSVMEQTGHDKEVIVVDNASSDGTAEMLTHEYPDVVVLRKSTNIGAGGGRNAGTAVARGEIIVYLDDDATLFTTDTAERVIRYFNDRPDVGVLGFRILDPETKQTCRASIPRCDRRLLTENTPIAALYGGACAFLKEVFDKTGGYWKMLDPYGAEDAELACRVIDQGYNMLWVMDITVCHSRSDIARPKGRDVYIFARNHPFLALRNLPWIYVLSHYFLWWARGFLFSIKDVQPRSYLRGVVDSIREAPVVLKQRKVVKPSTVEQLKKYAGRLWY
jgi:GT2 family glycosyltransferase